MSLSSGLWSAIRLPTWERTAVASGVYLGKQV